MNIYNINSPERLQAPAPSYLDVKHLNDQAADWRLQVRQDIARCRALRGAIPGAEKFRRQVLKKEYELSRSQVAMAWCFYRQTQAEAHRLTGQYLEQFSPARETGAALQRAA